MSFEIEPENFKNLNTKRNVQRDFQDTINNFYIKYPSALEKTDEVNHDIVQLI
jgi:hypothetical protein